MRNYLWTALLATTVLLALTPISVFADDETAPEAAPPPNSPTCDWGFHNNGTPITCAAQNYPVQGNTARGPEATHDDTFSTVAFPSNTGVPDYEPLILPTGECYYITNASPNTYFVPMKTRNEWQKFKSAVDGHNVPGLRIIRCDHSDVVVDKVDGVCGVADGIPSLTRPTVAALCSSGAPTAVVRNTTCSWNWSCTGTDTSTTQTCSAPRVTRAGSVVITTPAQLVIVLDASASMEDLVASAMTAIRQLMPGFTLPNVQIRIVAVGGHGYSAIEGTGGFPGRNSCRYGDIYDSANPGLNGELNNYGLSTVEAASFTPIAQAIAYAGSLLNPAAAHTAMLVLTDGADTCHGDIGQAVADQKARGVKTFAIAYQSASYEASYFTNFDNMVTATTPAAIYRAIENTLVQATNAVCPAPVD